MGREEIGGGRERATSIPHEGIQKEAIHVTIPDRFHTENVFMPYTK